MPALINGSLSGAGKGFADGGVWVKVDMGWGRIIRIWEISFDHWLDYGQVGFQVRSQYALRNLARGVFHIEHAKLSYVAKSLRRAKRDCVYFFNEARAKQTKRVKRIE